jgi:hypothetical protein
MAEPSLGHESSAILVPRVLMVAMVTAVAILLVVLIVCLSLRERLEHSGATAHTSVAAIPPPPRLQAQPTIDLAALRSEKQAALEAWGWTDSTRQFARIPIERAMVVYAAERAAAARDRSERQPAGRR